MTRYVIGDIQGCYNEFALLLDKIAFNPSTDTLYFVGDLVNRGPESLKMLEWLYKHQDSIVTVLGNHDIYLLARYSNVIEAEALETIQDILSSPTSPKLIDWLRRQPIVVEEKDFILAHAGIYPKMNFNQLLNLANAVSASFQSDYYAAFLNTIYGNKPRNFCAEDDPQQQMKFIVNACTRMRYLKQKDFSLDYKYKGEFETQPPELVPWFTTEFDPSIKKKIIFGHWASLGFFRNEKVTALDTGCVWGHTLSALNVDTNQLIQVESIGT